MIRKRIFGKREPRLYTRPLRRLTPRTSYGFAVIAFARDVLEHPLDPWQEWLVIHAGELLPDGRPRFRQVLVLVARQNGKTTLLMVLALFWLFKERVDMVLGTSSLQFTAKESWLKAVELCERHEDFASRIKVRYGSGEQELALIGGGRYKIASSNRRGGRGLTVDRLIMDEVREHQNWDAYLAVEPTIASKPAAQLYMISNQGDDRSVVLKSLRDQALAGSDARLGLFEWSARDGAEATDVKALAAANPSLGLRIQLDSLLGEARRAQHAGGQQLAGFLTEHQCRWVPMLDPAIDVDAWDACEDFGTLEAIRSRVALCLEIAEDNQHSTLVAAAVLADKRVRLETVKAWDGLLCIQQMRAELPALVERVKPYVIGWYSNGPAAAFAPDMAKKGGWPPRGVLIEDIRGDTPASCMGFSEQVGARQVAHIYDPLLSEQVAGAEKQPHGDGWRFTRRGAGHCDAVWAMAGATHLARTLPVPRRPVVLLGRG